MKFIQIRNLSWCNIFCIMLFFCIIVRLDYAFDCWIVKGNLSLCVNSCSIYDNKAEITNITIDIRILKPVSPFCRFNVFTIDIITR